MNLDEAKKWFKDNLSPENWDQMKGKVEAYYDEKKHFVVKDGKVDLTDFTKWAKGEYKDTGVESVVDSLKSQGLALINDLEPKAKGWLDVANKFLGKNRIGTGSALAGLALGAFLTGGASVIIPLVIAAGGFVLGGLADPQGVIKGGHPPAPTSPDSSTPTTPAGDGPKPAKFDEKNVDEVKALQTQINNYYELAPTAGIVKLDVNGKMDANTKAQWLKFKREVWTDDLPSVDYLKKSIGMSDDQLKSNGIDPTRYMTDEERKSIKPDVVIKIQNALKITPTGKLDDETRKAIKLDKIENWTNDMVNNSAHEALTSEIKAKAAAAKEHGEKLPADLNPENPGYPPTTPGKGPGESPKR